MCFSQSNIYVPHFLLLLLFLFLFFESIQSYIVAAQKYITQLIDDELQRPETKKLVIERSDQSPISFKTERV
jgi:hypothetical protein